MREAVKAPESMAWRFCVAVGKVGVAGELQRTISPQT